MRAVVNQPSAQLVTYVGVGLIVWGASYFLRRLGISRFLFDFSPYLWPVLLIIAGVLIIARASARSR